MEGEEPTMLPPVVPPMVAEARLEEQLAPPVAPPSMPPEMVAVSPERAPDLPPAVVAPVEKHPDPGAFPATDYVVVRILEDVPAFAGPGRNYRLIKEDLVSLPPAIAKALVARKKAVGVRTFSATR
jgi:DNA replication factor GINS